jgi:transcriptional regulator with XRE-family HTH domain
MDMRIDGNRIRAEREKRAWSQDHLAEVSGVSLRTVQRVESGGAASYETARSLAAVFEVDVVTLATPARTARRKPAWIAVAASLAAGIGGLFIAQQVRADQVMLDVDLALDDQPLSQSQHLVVAEGKEAEIRFEGQMRVVIAPTITKDGSVLLSLRIDEFSKQDWVRLGDPRLLANDNAAATVSVTSPGGNVIRIGITPHKLGKAG